MIRSSSLNFRTVIYIFKYIQAIYDLPGTCTSMTSSSTTNAFGIYVGIYADNGTQAQT